MPHKVVSLADCAKTIVDNRGRTCPVGKLGLPLIATNCLRSGSLYPTYETDRYVAPDVFANWFRGHPEPGDILFVLKGSPGRVCLAPDPVDFCIAQDMVAIRADEKVVYPKFLFALLRSPEAQKAINDLHVGTMIPHFKKGDFDKLKVALPEMRRQVEIGDFHFELCSRIDNLRQTNATLEAIAAALFKSWFVDFDGVAAEDMQESELGLIPKGWRVGALADLCELNSSKWTDKKHPATVRYVDLSGVSANRIETITEFAFNEAPSRARLNLREGDTIVGTVRPGNRAFAYIHEPESNLTGSTGFAVLSPKQSHFSSFIYLAATRNESIERLANLADGAAYPAVRPNVVAETPCVIPADEVLDEVLVGFSGITKPLLERVARSSRQAATLAVLRDALLPRLISGKLRVKQ